MSVINKALKELNKRNSGEEYGKYVPPEKSGFSFNQYAMVTLAVLGIAVMGAAGYYAYKIGTQSRQGDAKIQTELKGKVSADSDKKVTAAVNEVQELKEDVSAKAEQAVEEAAESGKNVMTDDGMEIANALGDVSDEASESAGIEITVADGDEDGFEPGSPVLDVHKKTTRNLIKDSGKERRDVQKTVKTQKQQKSSVAVNRSRDVDDYIYDADNYVIEEQPVVSERPKSKPTSLKVAKSKLTPEEQKALYRKEALNYMGKGDSRKAAEAYRNVLAVDPRDTEAREKLAGLYFGQGNYSDAVRVLDRGIALTPTHYDYRLFLSRIYKSRGDDVKALKVLETAAPPVAGNVDYYATMASIARDSGNYAAASKAYRALASTNTSDGKWYLGLGISEEKQGKSKQALEAYRKASSMYLSQSSRKFVEGRIKFLEKLK